MAEPGVTVSDLLNLVLDFAVRAAHYRNEGQVLSYLEDIRLVLAIREMSHREFTDSMRFLAREPRFAPWG